MNACMHAKSLQSCPALCDPMDCSPPGSSVHGILQARTLEWVAVSFSSAGNCFSRVQLFASLWTVARRAPLSMGFPGKNTGVDCHFLLQGIFPTQGLNPGLSRIGGRRFNL